MTGSVIIDAVRSPIGIKQGRMVGNIRPDELTAQILKALLEYGTAPWSCRSTVVSTIGSHTKKHPELISTFEELLFDPNRDVRTTAAVSYTHLTLPTILLV